MAWRIVLFLGVLLAVLGGAGSYMALRSMALCPPLGRHPSWVWGFFGAFTLLLFLAPILQRVPGLDSHVAPLFWLAHILFSLVSTYFVTLLMADIVQGLLRFGGWRIGPWAVGCALGVTLLACGWGAVMALRPVEVRRVEIPITGLPQELEGFRIVQISDLHLGPLVRRAQVDHVVSQSNALHPDLIAITGDLVDGEADGVRPLAERMRILHARHGVFFITGNHEYYSGVTRWLEVIRGMGWKVLDNECQIIQHGSAGLAVAGMPDPASRSLPGHKGPDLRKTLANAPSDMPLVLLYHPPTGTKAAARSGVDLQLSGHTHGGQYFPWNMAVSAIFDHPRGLSREGAMWVYTSVGTGFWGPPNRLLVPPELTLIILKRG
ncbi:metallophosphoesterase [Holophaga foetida]|uniref:metallophosphoesterase n=1 Tax=Holophaga foetida TaxID=35839 RepID=UPI0002473328|nr:metallophosphoesterase [Holophaga foetida]